MLEDINLEVAEGDFMGLIGPNGGGKTTLLKVLLGMIKPDKGSVEIFGLNPVAARKFIGYVPQKNIFDPNFPVTALDVVLMGRYSRARLFKRYGQKDKEEAKKALRSVGMEEYTRQGDRIPLRRRAAEGLCGQIPGIESKAPPPG